MTTPEVVIPIGLIGTQERRRVVEYSDLTPPSQQRPGVLGPLIRGQSPGADNVV